MKKTIIVFIFILFITGASYSQSTEETLSNLSSDAATSYVEPIISAFGSNMNSGWVSGVPSASILGFNIKLRAIVAGSFFPEDKRTFSTSGKFRYTSEQAEDILQASGITQANPNYDDIKNEILSREWEVNISGPTITGSDQEFVEVTFPGAQIQGETIGEHTNVLTGVKGFLNDIPLLPTPMLQLDVGDILGTGVSIRYFPGIDIQDLGKISLWGMGFMHNPGVWLANPLPIDIGLGFFYQNLKVGDIFENKSYQYGAFISKEIGVIITFTPYAGVTFESSKTTLNYTYNFDTPAGPQSTNVSFDLDGENNIALTGGVTLSLPIVSINVDYKLAKVSALTAGVALGF